MAHGLTRIDRYVITETVGPVFLGFLVSTFILLIRAFFELAEAILHDDDDADEAEDDGQPADLPDLLAEQRPGESRDEQGRGEGDSHRHGEG